MTPLPFVLPYAIVFWITMAWAFSPEFRIIGRAKRSVGAADAKSLHVILYVGGLASLISYPLAWVTAFQFSSHRVLVFYIGVSALILGSLLRRHCWGMLGTSFTGDVRASADQQVVTRGAYALLRHPSYTAGIIMNVAIGIALGSWASALLQAVASFAAYRYRIIVEERALLSVIGEPYERFMRTRKRLIPFVY